MEKNKKIPKKYSSRSGCFWCKQPLTTMKEKILRTCDQCAKSALTSANKMANGEVKEGFRELKDKTIGGCNPIMEKKIDIALKREEKKIIKLGKKKGLSEQQIKESIEIFRKG